jgi:hypothetical protein
MRLVCNCLAIISATCTGLADLDDQRYAAAAMLVVAGVMAVLSRRFPAPGDLS